MITTTDLEEKLLVVVGLQRLCLNRRSWFLDLWRWWCRSEICLVLVGISGLDPTCGSRTVSRVEWGFDIGSRQYKVVTLALRSIPW